MTGVDAFLQYRKTAKKFLVWVTRLFFKFLLQKMHSGKPPSPSIFVFFCCLLSVKNLILIRFQVDATPRACTVKLFTVVFNSVS